MSDHAGEECCTYLPRAKTAKGPPTPAPCGGTGHGTLAEAIAHIPDAAFYTVPWWGDKWTANLRNAGYVIGFQDSRNAMRHWHLDYDPGKGLHLNWEDKTKFPAKKIYHKVTTLGVALIPAVTIINNAVDDQTAISLPDARCKAEVNQHMLWIAWSRAALGAGQVPGNADKATICKARIGNHDANDWNQIEDFVNDNYQAWLNEK